MCQFKSTVANYKASTKLIIIIIIIIKIKAWIFIKLL
jgi:hypothetical protein